MGSRLRSIHRLWLITIAVSLIIAGLSAYALRDGTIHDVVAQLQHFKNTFDSTTVSNALTEAARAQGQVPVSTLGPQISGPGVPDMQVDPNAMVAPRGEVAVATLAQAKSRQTAGQTPIGVVDPASLGKAIAFRLARASEPGPLLLQSVELLPTALSEKDAQLLLDAEDARLKSVSTRKTLVTAQADQERLEELYEARAKWHAPVKVLKRTREERDEARKTRSDAQIAWETASNIYQEEAKAALALKTEATQQGPLGMALAKVTMARVAGKPPLVLKVPTKLKETNVQVPPLAGIELSRVEQSFLWSTISDETPDNAIEHARRSFTVFSRTIELGGVRISSAWVLQAGVLLLPLLLWILTRRCRTATRGYDPFAKHESLPQVGMRSDALNLILTSLLPGAVALECSYTQWRLQQWPLVSVPCALAAVLLGIRVQGKLRELRELQAAVVRSISVPPNAPLSITPLPPAPELTNPDKRS